MSVVTGRLPTFKKATSLQGCTGLSLLIFGPPGIGKTTLAATAQDSEFGKEVLLFNIDPGGAVSIMDREDVSIWPDPESTENPTWIEFRKVVDQLVALGAESPYKTIVFDSISSIYDDLIKPKVVGSTEKQPQLNQWGECNRYLIKFMLDVMTLNTKGINTIFIGHSLEEKDEDTITVRLAGTPKGRDEILRNIGNVAFYDFDRRKVDRVLKFKPERKVDGPKFRQPQSGDQMPLEMTNPTMHDILKYARKGK
jgi:hypothetical protein